MNTSQPDVMNDADMTDHDRQIQELIKSKGTEGISVSEIQAKLGDRALIRAGILLSRQQLRVISGGGSSPYIVTIND